MQDGYVLDYVYRAIPLGGLPVLYARPENSTRISSYEDYLQAIASTDSSAPDGQPETGASWSDGARGPGHLNQWLPFLKTDGTEDGFIELAVLRTVAGQFCLEWHAHYDDHLPVCDKSGVEALLAREFFRRRLSRKVRTAARKLDVEPVVVFSGESADVSLIVFTKWGGFLKRTTTFSREYPHRILSEVEETLVEYDCAVRF